MLYLIHDFLKSYVFLIIIYYTMKKTNYKNMIKRRANTVKTAIPEPPEWREARYRLQAIRDTMQTTEELYKLGMMDLGDKILEACHREMATMPGMENFHSPFIPETNQPVAPRSPRPSTSRAPRPPAVPEEDRGTGTSRKPGRNRNK